MALLKDVKRSATILALEDTHVFNSININKVGYVGQDTFRLYSKKDRKIKTINVNEIFY